MPATTVETGAMPGAPYVGVAANDNGWSLHDRVTVHNLWWVLHVSLHACHAGSGWFGHSQGKWFAPGEALPPGYVITTHPEGHSAPQEGHAMSEMASASFVIPASSAAAAVKTGSAVKSKKSKKKKSSGCC